ncbi:MAG TPA: zinc-ribbon and DUF3426 domain-containing protein [Usitatibacter sp.]|nr:zinc-ribbon and DUF3426 domain-containing protein [Usitatibacter sp.]
MLITSCNHCGARFRVTPQQLNAKQGQVRCGRCRQVFNGFVRLERFPDDDTGARLLAEAERAAQAKSGTPPENELPDLESLDAPQPAPEPQRAPEPQPEPEPEAPAQPEYVEPPAPVASTPPPAGPPAPRGAPPVAAISLPALPQPDPPARAWAFGTVLLALVLAAELTYAFRGTIAQRYPVLRPYLESACDMAGCNVPWAHEESLLKLEDSELLEVPGKPGEISLNARIRNLAPAAQEYPYIEVTLTDIGGQPAIRRVLPPADYLGRPLTGGETIAAGAELNVQLRLETPRIKATGYELLLFYP